HFRLQPSVGRVGDGEREVPVGGPDVLGLLGHHDVIGWAEQDVRAGSFRGEAVVFIHLLAAFQRAFEHYESMRIASKEGAVEAVEVDLDLGMGRDAPDKQSHNHEQEAQRRTSEGSPGHAAFFGEVSVATPYRRTGLVTNETSGLTTQLPP